MHRPQPMGIFGQLAPTPSIRRSRNAFEGDDDDIEELTSLGTSHRTRLRRSDTGSDGEENYSVEETTGLEHMTEAQSRLARLFQPPFDLISNYDLEMVGRQSHDVKELQANLCRLKTTGEHTRSGLLSTFKVYTNFSVKC